MRNKLTVPWISRLAAGRLFHWRRNSKGNHAGQNLLIEDDFDHLGALHAAAKHTKKK